MFKVKPKSGEKRKPLVKGHFPQAPVKIKKIGEKTKTKQSRKSGLKMESRKKAAPEQREMEKNVVQQGSYSAKAEPRNGVRLIDW